MVVTGQMMRHIHHIPPVGPCHNTQLLLLLWCSTTKVAVDCGPADCAAQHKKKSTPLSWGYPRIQAETSTLAKRREQLYLAELWIVRRRPKVEKTVLSDIFQLSSAPGFGPIDAVFSEKLVIGEIAKYHIILYAYQIDILALRVLIDRYIER